MSQDREVLRNFLSGRKCSCPSCGYSLTNCESDRCPECGGQLELTLKKKRQYLVWQLLFIVSAINTGWSLPLWIHIFAGEVNHYPYPHRLIVYIYISSVFTLALVCVSVHRFNRLSLQLQWMVFLAYFILSIVMYVILYFVPQGFEMMTF